MPDHEVSPQLHRLAKAIYAEIRKQFDCAGPSVPMVCDHSGMRDVLVQGHIDLVKVAAALSMRCCVQMPDIETVDEARPAGRSKSPITRTRLPLPSALVHPQSPGKASQTAAAKAG